MGSPRHGEPGGYRGGFLSGSHFQIETPEGVASCQSEEVEKSILVGEVADLLQQQSGEACRVA